MGLLKHFFILLIIFIVQISLPSLTAWSYLRIVEYNIQNNFYSDRIVYHSGEYVPLFVKHVNLNNDWENEIKELISYYVVIVKKNGNFTDEIYYTKNGREEIVRYRGNKIIEHSTNKDYPADSLLLLPFFSLAILLIGAIKYHFRTGTYTTFANFFYVLNENESIFRLYGLGMIVITILSMIIQDTDFSLF